MTKLTTTLILLFVCLSAQAAVEVSDAWARATPPGQTVGAAYMSLKSDHITQLVGASSPAAESIEVHDMSMDGGVMKMRMIESLILPAGELVKLAPGGFHLMLFNLKKPLTDGDNIDVELVLKNPKGEVSKQKVRLPVRMN